MWIAGVGGVERQPDGMWKLTMTDSGIDKSAAAAALGSSTSQAKAEAERTLAALRLATQFVAKANADGAYTNTAMSGDRALAKINAALYGDSDQDAW